MDDVNDKLQWNPHYPNVLGKFGLAEVPITKYWKTGNVEGHSDNLALRSSGIRIMRGGLYW